VSKYNELKRLAEAATPQDFDSAEEKTENGYIECPHCGGEGEVERQVDYCNYDNVAIGVQFYGIGNEFGAAEAYYRAANPAAVIALIADFNAEHALRLEADKRGDIAQRHLDRMIEHSDSLERQVGELREQLAMMTADKETMRRYNIKANENNDALHAKLDEVTQLLREVANYTRHPDYDWFIEDINAVDAIINTTSTEGKDEYCGDHCTAFDQVEDFTERKDHE
jgi:hypothetical protein